MKSLLQTKIWSDFKSHHGWRVHQLGDALALERELSFRQRFLYIPELIFTPDTNFPQILETTKQLATDRKAFVVRFDLLTEYHPELADQLEQYGLRKSFEEIQPEFRQWIDLTPTTDTILAQMKQKGRYNIHLAEKHGVTVAPERDANLFTDLLKVTATRGGFSVRTPVYYYDLAKALIDGKCGELLVARHNDKVLAAGLFSYYDGTCLYLHGGSSNNARELMAPYLLHWVAMQRAKERNCTTYDLLAIAPFEDENYKLTTTTYNLVKKYAGITRFKQQFGGRSVHLLGAWDLVTRPFIYSGFQTLQQLRRK